MSPPLFDSTDARPIHFVGIAGAGMSALAELFLRRGVAITGCDAHPETAGDLRRLGVSVTDHDPSHVDSARALVVTSAMPKDHPELVRARERGIPVIRRAEALGEVTVGRELVGIAGTHGKTTTTVMTAMALGAAGRDPTALVGGRVGDWGGNLRAGSDRLYVVEADEYDRSFLALTPTVAVVTNIEADHLDIYADLADIRRTFAQFVKGARHIVLCADDANANALSTPSSTEVVRYGIASADARLVARDISAQNGTTAFHVTYDDESLGGVELRVPGRHNVLNALAAIGSGLVLGADLTSMARGLAEFRGAERRFQRLGDAGGVTVVDDYAHHPTEISATLAAARSSFPGRRLVVAFQPHLYTRTRDFASEFGASLAAADAVFLTEIYPAREKPIEGVSSTLVESAVRQSGGRLQWRGRREELADALAAFVREGDAVITLGAGDITKTGAELLARLAAPA
ncbi:MAG TPA: UDP-N-acetylmuramate--L-alanine ligase [Gemmatimonadaceae bacterium]|nr:UDP-N-acetylmuramate--L-alanine ligase [Gemmatimonadaceae bacterium]